MELTIKAFDTAREIFVKTVDELAKRCKTMAESSSSGKKADYLNYVSAAMGSAAMSIAGHSVMSFEAWQKMTSTSRSRHSEL